MKHILSFLFILACVSLNSQINFKTGSAEFDLELNTMNVEAKADLTSFKASLKVDFSTNSTEIDKLFKLKLEPAEVFLTLSIADVAKKPATDVANSYTKNKGKGWGYIAKEMGIKPGSPEFHALKGKSKKSKGNGNSKGNNGNGNGKGKKK